MIKRLFFKQEHSEKNAASDSSSSSSVSEMEAGPTEETDNEDDSISEFNDNEQAGSMTPGSSDDDGSDAENIDILTRGSGKDVMLGTDAARWVLKRKSTFRCRLCPRIVCLNGETLKAHLESKRHARSHKLFKEGRLKLMLNSDGELEGETHAERHARIMGLVEENPKKKRNEGRHCQRRRPKRKDMDTDPNMTKVKQTEKKPASKKSKIGD